MQQFEAIWSLQQAVEQSTFSAVFACQFEFDLALTHARSCLSVYTDIFTYTYTHTHTQMPVGVCVSSFISAAWLKFFWNYNCNINISFKFTHVACAPLSPLQLQVRLRLQFRLQLDHTQCKWRLDKLVVASASASASTFFSKHLWREKATTPKNQSKHWQCSFLKMLQVRHFEILRISSWYTQKAFALSVHLI